MDSENRSGITEEMNVTSRAHRGLVGEGGICSSRMFDCARPESPNEMDDRDRSVSWELEIEKPCHGSSRFKWDVPRQNRRIVQGSKPVMSDRKIQNIFLKSLILIFAATELMVKSVWV